VQDRNGKKEGNSEATEASLASRLRKVTDVALKRADEEEKRKELEERHRAEQIIATIQEQALHEAEQGKDHLVIMTVTYSRSPRFAVPDGFTLEPDKLTGASRFVYEYCNTEGLNPKLVSRWVSLKTNIHRIDFYLLITW
jgi:hypothetical protein